MAKMTKVSIKQQLSALKGDLERITRNIQAIEEWVDALPERKEGILMPDYDDDALMLHVEATDVPHLR